MKAKSFLLVLGSVVCISSHALTIEPINASSAKMCGLVTKATTFKKGTYLNLEGDYPKQAGTITVWEKYTLQKLEGKYVCAIGESSMYRGKPYVGIHSLKQLEVN